MLPMPSMPKLLEEAFPEPPGWRDTQRKAWRQCAVDRLLPAMQDAVFLAWRDELPPAAVARCCQHIRIATRAAVRQLSTKPNLELALSEHYGPWTTGIPDYWEPAEALGQDLLRPVQLRAYRWAAAVIGRAVRDKLEVLHAKYTSNDCMPALNRAVRNAVLGVCLQDPLTGYLLGHHLAWLVVVSQRPFATAFRIPPAAGR